MMRSCQEVSRLASEQMDRELTLRERLAFNVHLMMCRKCLRYARQIALVKQATDRLRQRSERPAPARLPEDARERIAQRLAASSHGDPRDTRDTRDPHG
jgi:predicted anti-sigma-YlaC factor YlaD